MEETTKRKAGRPPKVSPDNTEIKVSEDISVEAKTEVEAPTEVKRKTALEYLAEFDNNKFLDVPEVVKKKYPNTHFVWVHNDEKRITPKEGKGYFLIQSPELSAKKVGIKGYRTITDDYVRYGGLILMGCPEEYYEAREMKKEMDLIARSNSVRSSSKLHNAVTQSGLNIPVTAKFTQTRG